MPTRIVVILPSNEEVPAVVGGDGRAGGHFGGENEKPGARGIHAVEFGNFGFAGRWASRCWRWDSPLAMSQSVTLGIVSNSENGNATGVRFGAVYARRGDVGSLVRWDRLMTRTFIRATRRAAGD